MIPRTDTMMEITSKQIKKWKEYHDHGDSKISPIKYTDTPNPIKIIPNDNITTIVLNNIDLSSLEQNLSIASRGIFKMISHFPKVLNVVNWNWVDFEDCCGQDNIDEIHINNENLIHGLGNFQGKVIKGGKEIKLEDQLISGDVTKEFIQNINSRFTDMKMSDVISLHQWIYSSGRKNYISEENNFIVKCSEQQKNAVFKLIYQKYGYNNLSRY